jgi:hypothetical protein
MPPMAALSQASSRFFEKKRRKKLLLIKPAGVATPRAK